MLLVGTNKRLTAARERIRTLTERYEDSFRSGNIAKLVSDLRYCDENGKFEHRESTLDFLKENPFEHGNFLEDAKTVHLV